MMVNGDYRGSNYTMSSDDEVFNVSNVNLYSNFVVLVSTNQSIDVAPWDERLRICLFELNRETYCEEEAKSETDNEYGWSWILKSIIVNSSQRFRYSWAWPRSKSK